AMPRLEPRADPYRVFSTLLLEGLRWGLFGKGKNEFAILIRGRRVLTVGAVLGKCVSSVSSSSGQASSLWSSQPTRRGPDIRDSGFGLGADGIQRHRGSA